MMCIPYHSKDADRLGDELSLQRMKSLSESQRALELERKLYSSEQLLKQVRLAIPDRHWLTQTDTGYPRQTLANPDRHWLTQTDTG